MSLNQPSTTESIQICLLLSLLALSTNFFLSVSIIGQLDLLFGSIFVFLAMLILPLRYLIFVASAALLALFVQEQLWSMSFLFILEITVIYLLKQKEVFLLLASLLFWLLLGVPFLLIVNYFNTYQLEGEGVIIALHTAFNSILCVAIAFTIFSLIPNSWLKPRISQQNRLSSNIFAICASTLIAPLLIASLSFISKQVSQQEVLTSDRLLSKSMFVGQLTTGFIAQHEHIVETLAVLASISNNRDLLHEAMIYEQENHSAFFNITTVDSEGNLGFFAPARYNEEFKLKLPERLQTVRDRQYFRDTKQKQKTVISDALMSRGVLNTPMIAIASPIFNNNQFDGILFGTLNLLSLNNFSSQIERLTTDKLVIITDAQNNIVFSTQMDEFSALNPFIFAKHESRVIKTMPLMRLNSTDYLYQKIRTEYDWHVYVLQKADSFSINIRNQLFLLGLGLLVGFTVFLFFAYKLSNKITAPLIKLLQNEDSFSIDEMDANHTSKEFSDVAKKLKRSSYLMKNFENRLKLQVEEKTEQLEQLNLQLAAQAREDGLTGLLNRGGFNELALNAIKTNYRLNQTFSIALLDLDLFKNINDTYGHLIGDKCLVEFANIMQGFCKRETDIIGRYGGEEFIIFLSGGSIDNQHSIIENIHQRTRDISVIDPESKDSIRFTVSIGVCSVINTISLELRDLIQIADEELYKCKRSGRDKVSISIIGE